MPVCDTEGLEMTAIRNVAKENGITLVVGVIERCDRPETGKKREEYGSSVAGGSGTIYCTAITISEAGEVVASHRKLMQLVQSVLCGDREMVKASELHPLELAKLALSSAGR